MALKNTLLEGDALAHLQCGRSKSVQCCVTSPPYFGLRDYGTGKWVGGKLDCAHDNGAHPTFPNTKNPKANITAGGNRGGGNACVLCGAKRVDLQVGLEPTPEAYVDRLVAIFREVRRVLRNDGTLWLNLGDSYASGGMSNPGTKLTLGGGKDRGAAEYQIVRAIPDGLKPKDLIGIPWRVAFALQADGWYLRSDIIWHKPNQMPESVMDRPTKAHEYVFLLSKSKQYFYDAEAVKEPASIYKPWGHYSHDLSKQAVLGQHMKGHLGIPADEEVGRNRRSVWTIPTRPYTEAHFAVFPTALAKLCIQAGTSAKGECEKCGSPWELVTERTDEQAAGARGSRFDAGKTSARDGGNRTQSGERFKKRMVGWKATCKHDAAVVPQTVLDPFAGSGTTLAVAQELGRCYVGIELNPEYVKLAKRRLSGTPMGIPLA